MEVIFFINRFNEFSICFKCLKYIFNFDNLIIIINKLFDMKIFDLNNLIIIISKLFDMKIFDLNNLILFIYK